MMYYYCMLVLLLAGCAHADVPDYLSALSNNNLSTTELLKNLNAVNPGYRYNYLVLKATVSLLADVQLVFKVDYDKVYKLVTDLAVILVRAFPNVFRDLALKRLEVLQKDTAKLSKLVSETCFPRLRAPASCNKDVDALVKKDKELQKEASVFLAFGELGSAYLNQANELRYVALRYQQEQYLENGKQKLRYLTKKVLEAYRALYLY